MISVQNHLPRLSGNKWLLFLFTALLASACSPKVRTVSVPAKTEPVAVNKEPAKPAVKPAPKVSSIAMILPFDLDKVNPGVETSRADLKKSELALDYYQGFRLALDSLTNLGYNFKLQLYDSKDQQAQAHSLAFNAGIRSSDIVIGPVFPEDIKAFTATFTAHKPVVSPLSPASPGNFRDVDLITVTPPLEYHAIGAAKYINDKIKPKKVFILKSGFSEENKYIVPFKNATDSLSNKKIQIVPFTVVRGNLTTLESQLSLTDQNVVLMPSTDQAFLTVTLRSLDSLAKKYPVTLFGHPNWEKLPFLHAQLMQRLKTHITSSERVNYKAANTNTFVRKYFKAYHLNPSDYAVKGFDEGLYFGTILANNASGIKKLDTIGYKGLHNSFHFVKKPGQGWVNSHVDVLKYTNFELRKAE